MNTRYAFLLAVALVAAASTVQSGCASDSRAARSTSPYSAFEPAVRDTQLAREKYAKALAAWPDDPAKAETLLREALDADIYTRPGPQQPRGAPALARRALRSGGGVRMG